jgi:hypothetical protein
MTMTEDHTRKEVEDLGRQAHAIIDRMAERGDVDGFPNRWLQEAMGARSQRYFLGRRGVDTGWELRQLKPHQARPVW